MQNYNHEAIINILENPDNKEPDHQEMMEMAKKLMEEYEKRFKPTNRTTKCATLPPFWLAVASYLPLSVFGSYAFFKKVLHFFDESTFATIDQWPGTAPILWTLSGISSSFVVGNLIGARSNFAHAGQYLDDHIFNRENGNHLRNANHYFKYGRQLINLGYNKIRHVMREMREVLKNDNGFNENKALSLSHVLDECEEINDAARLFSTAAKEELNRYRASDKISINLIEKAEESYSKQLRKIYKQTIRLTKLKEKLIKVRLDIKRKEIELHTRQNQGGTETEKTVTITTDTVELSVEPFPRAAHKGYLRAAQNKDIEDIANSLNMPLPKTFTKKYILSDMLIPETLWLISTMFLAVLALLTAEMTAVDTQFYYRDIQDNSTHVPYNFHGVNVENDWQEWNYVISQPFIRYGTWVGAGFIAYALSAPVLINYLHGITWIWQKGKDTSSHFLRSLATKITNCLHGTEDHTQQPFLNEVKDLKKQMRNLKKKIAEIIDNASQTLEQSNIGRADPLELTDEIISEYEETINVCEKYLECAETLCRKADTLLATNEATNYWHSIEKDKLENKISAYFEELTDASEDYYDILHKFHEMRDDIKKFPESMDDSRRIIAKTYYYKIKSRKTTVENNHTTRIEQTVAEIRQAQESSEQRANTDHTAQQINNFGIWNKGRRHMRSAQRATSGQGANVTSPLLHKDEDVQSSSRWSCTIV